MKLSKQMHDYCKKFPQSLGHGCSQEIHTLLEPKISKVKKHQYSLQKENQIGKLSQLNPVCSSMGSESTKTENFLNYTLFARLWSHQLKGITPWMHAGCGGCGQMPIYKKLYRIGNHHCMSHRGYEKTFNLRSMKRFFSVQLLYRQQVVACVPLSNGRLRKP